MRSVTGLVLLGEGSEAFPGNMLGFKVISEVEKFAGVLDNEMATEVGDRTEEFVVPETGITPEVDVKLTVVSEMIVVVSLLF